MKHTVDLFLKCTIQIVKMVHLGEFFDRSVLIGQKLVENAKFEKFKYDILCDFQTLWMHLI